MKNSLMDSLGDSLGGEAKNTGGLRIDIDDIQPDPEQPRTFVDDEGERDSIEALAESILAHGVLQPITVRPDGDGKYVLIAGERRLRAAKIARDSGRKCERAGYDLKAVPAVIIEPKSAVDRLEMQLVENLAREDMSTEDIAKALNQVIAQTAVSQRKLAARLGRSPSWIQLMLSHADPALVEAKRRLGMKDDDKVDANVARTLVRWQKDIGGRDRLFAHLKKQLAGGEDLKQTVVNELDAAYVAAEKLASGLVEHMKTAEFVKIPAFEQVLKVKPKAADRLLAGWTVQEVIQAPDAEEPKAPAPEPSAAEVAEYDELSEAGEAAFTDEASGDLEVPGTEPTDNKMEHQRAPITDLDLAEGEQAIELSGDYLDAPGLPEPHARVHLAMHEGLAKAVCAKAGVEYKDADSVLEAIQVLAE